MAIADAQVPVTVIVPTAVTGIVILGH
eukprot:COSAG01_NODE_30614_length_612_cov_18.988304_2_plen_26_part_01